MPILKYENLTHSELGALPREKTVVLLPAGPLEQHGPHLPLGSDAFSAEYFSERMAERLEAARPDWHFLIFPTIFAGCDTLTYTGSVEVRPATFRALLLDCCKQLARDGFKSIIAVGAHGGPRHMVVLEEVAARMRWRHRARMVSASARILFEVLRGTFVEKIAVQMERAGHKLSDDERAGLKNDYHGGLLETSLLMVARPELVKPTFKTLQPAILKSIWHFRRSSGKTVGQGLGYLGSPALARPEIGQAAVEVLINDSVPLLERFLDGADVSRHFRSKFYYVPFFRTDFKIFILLVLYPMLLGAAWWSLSQVLVGLSK